ncbi:MAG: S9 family peptidase [Gemmataceae bacterium]
MKKGALFLVVCLLPTLAAAQETKRPITIDDLYALDAPAAAVLDPLGKRATYIRSWIDLASKKERHSLWTVAEPGKQRAMEKGEPDARAPVFSPDGKWIAFLSTRARPKGWKQTPPAPPYSDAPCDVWLIPAEGGEAVPLAGPDKPYGRVFNDGFYGRVAFSKEGDRLVFVADDGVDPRSAAEKKHGVRVVREDQGEGYTGFGPAQIWIADLKKTPDECAAAKIERLTKDDVWYGDPQWSPDGKTLLVHANKTSDRESVRYSINKNYDIWSIDVASGKQTQLTFGPGPEVSPRFLPKGDGFVCLSVPRTGSHRDVFNIAVVTFDEAKPRMRLLFDHHTLRDGKAPHQPPAFPLPIECWDGARLAYASENRTTTSHSLVDLKTGAGSMPLGGSKDGARPSDRRKRLAELLPAGNAFLKERLVAPSEVVKWTSDGLRIDGILTVPPPEVAKPPYKLILYPHGGPHSRSALGFDFTVQVFAAHGYAILQPNFRGSFGYGQKFIDADRFDLGGGDMRDCLAGIDELIRKEQIDAKQLYVYGTSYGGFMTTWLVGQTDRFKAAVAQNAVTDLNMMWALTDIQSWTEWEFGGKPWEVPDKMRKHSPMTYVDKVKTPTLILHSRDDRRVPLPLGKAFHRALLARGVPTGMVIYPDEGHAIRQPLHREDVLRRVLAWYEKWR